jgi:hypothetical protein
MPCGDLSDAPVKQIQSPVDWFEVLMRNRL